MALPQLPSDVWQLIVNVNDKPRDIRSAELTCKIFKQLSRSRTSITTHVIHWSIASRYTNLIRVNGLITGCCEDIFKSKLQYIRVSTDTITPFIRLKDYESDSSSVTLSNKAILEWVAKYPKQGVAVHNNILHPDWPESDREMIYRWDQDYLTIMSLDDQSPMIVKRFREVSKKDAIVVVQIGSRSSDEPNNYLELLEQINPSMVCWWMNPSKLAMLNALATKWPTSVGTTFDFATSGSLVDDLQKIGITVFITNDNEWNDPWIQTNAEARSFFRTEGVEYDDLY